MANVDNDDPYGDDDLNDLPLETVDALEEFAFQATQTARQSSQKELPISNIPRYGTRNTANQTVTGEDQTHANSDDDEYGSVEDGDYGDVVLDDNAQPYARGDVSRHHELGVVSQRELWRLNRFGGTRPLNQHILEPLKPPANGQPQKQGLSRPVEISRSVLEEPEIDHDHMVIDSEETGPQTVNRDATELQVRINQLLHEKETLQQSLARAESTALSKAGEISIVRANQAKATKEYERKLTALQSIHIEEATKQKIELDRLAAEKERVATDNKFLKRDLAEEAERVKSLKRNISGSAAKSKGYPGARPSPLSTPEKVRALAYRDGFDDEEIQAFSPSKPIPSRSKGTTPKLGTKRKRKNVDDSPAKPLQLSQPVIEDSSFKEKFDSSLVIDEELLKRLGRQDTRFEFFQLILNHCPNDGTVSTFETLTRMHFPSSPQKSVSSVVLSKLSESDQTSNEELPQQMSKIFISIWCQCLEEKYHIPIMLLVDMLTFILLLDTITVAPDLISSLLPVAQDTIDKVGIPRWKQVDPSSLERHIEIHPCLSLLHLVALGSAQHDIQIHHFWQHIRFDVILMMLTTKQLPSDVLLILDLLATSVLPNSFGPLIIENEAKQRANEDHIIHFMTIMLGDPPKPPPTHTPYTYAEISTLHISILRLLTHISQTPHGSSIIAGHKSATGRIMQLASNSVDRLYDHRAGHADHATQIELCISLLHRLFEEHPNIDVGAKVAIVPGGAHKRLVTLTRLAFSEGLVLEMGISDTVVAYARELLENSITPEEGETLELAMEKTRGRFG